MKKGMLRLLQIIVVGIVFFALFNYGVPYIQDELQTDECEEEPVEDDNGGPPSVPGTIEYHFIDVGQADATLIQTEHANKLIDAGHWQRSDTVDYLNDIGVYQIDYLITTHPHADHIGEADDIINNFGVNTVFRSGYEHSSATYNNYVTAIEENNVEDIHARAGETYTLESISIEIINPTQQQFDDAVNSNDIHDASLCFIVHYGEHSVMFTGDAEADTEAMIIERGYDLDVHIYHAGHHGSYTSSTSEFLDQMNPDIVIISCGEDNQYGHPHDVIMDRLNDRDIEIRRTDKEGTIIITV